MRRPNAELEKNILCPFERCGKKYDRYTAVNLHIKLKHNGGNKQVREDYAKGLVELYSTGGVIAESQIETRL